MFGIQLGRFCVGRWKVPFRYIQFGVRFVFFFVLCECSERHITGWWDQSKHEGRQTSFSLVLRIRDTFTVHNGRVDQIFGECDGGDLLCQRMFACKVYEISTWKCASSWFQYRYVFSSWKCASGWFQYRICIVLMRWYANRWLECRRINAISILECMSGWFEYRN